MSDAMSPEAAAERIRETLDRMKADGVHLENILEAFRGLFVEQARLKAELPADAFDKIDVSDRERFAKGVPLTCREKLISIGEMWRMGAERLIPPMKEGFPKIREALERLQSEITIGNFDPAVHAAEALEDLNQGVLETATESTPEQGTVKFALINISRPFVAKRAETLKPFMDGLLWERGYCPVCGSLPELSILREKEGRRWLKCGFCGHEWPFMRMACPCCETQEEGNVEILFIEEREHERLDLCLHCRKYVAELDLRATVKEPALDVARLGLLHLDMLAQQKGFSPWAGYGGVFRKRAHVEKTKAWQGINAWFFKLSPHQIRQFPSSSTKCPWPRRKLFQAGIFITFREYGWIDMFVAEFHAPERKE